MGEENFSFLLEKLMLYKYERFWTIFSFFKESDGVCICLYLKSSMLGAKLINHLVIFILTKNTLQSVLLNAYSFLVNSCIIFIGTFSYSYFNFWLGIKIKRQSVSHSSFLYSLWSVLSEIERQHGTDHLFSWRFISTNIAPHISVSLKNEQYIIQDFANGVPGSNGGNVCTLEKSKI